MQALSDGVDAVKRGHLSADALTPAMTILSNALDSVFAGKFASVSWLTLIDPNAAAAKQKRRLIEIDPKLDDNALRPSHVATTAILSISADRGAGRLVERPGTYCPNTPLASAGLTSRRSHAPQFGNPAPLTGPKIATRRRQSSHCAGILGNRSARHDR